MISPEQFKEIITLKNFISGFIHEKTTVKGDSWEGAYLMTNSGEYIEFMQPGRNKGLGIAFSSKSSIYTDIRELKNEFKKMKWLKRTRVWGDGSKWFTWLSVKPEKEDAKLKSHFLTWAMFYHPRYYQSKNFSSETNKPASMARINSIDVFMNPKLTKYFQRHLKWTNATIKTTKKGMKVELLNREYENFTINIHFNNECEDFVFQKIILETHRMKKVKLPKLKTIKFIQKNGVIAIENNLL
jgi:hypothetical protein